MRILHVVPGVDEATNGIAVAARRLAQEQRRRGHDAVCAARFDDAAYHAADVVFVHSCWTPTVWRGCWGAIRAGRRLVRMTHACLDPVRLAYHGGRKLLAGPLERFLLRRSACVVATCAAERDWIQAYEPHVARVVAVPLGVDVPPEDALPTVAAATGPHRLLYLGRRHPLKGLDLLEEALARLTPGILDLRIESAVFGEDKARALAACDALVLPSRSENFGLVVAEALAAGKPVITTDGTPWEGVREKGCGWYVEGFRGGRGAEKEFDRERAVENSRRALDEFAATPREKLAEMGRRGRAWMAADFTWAAAVARLEEILGG